MSSSAISGPNVRKNASPFLAFFFSLFVHAFLLLLFGSTLVHLYHHEEKKLPLTAPPEVVFDLSPPVQERHTINTSSTHPLEKSPEHANFQSYENTAAASELPPTGIAPLPSQEGQEKETLSLHNADHAEGETVTPKAATPPFLTDQKKEESTDPPLTTKPTEAAVMPASDQPAIGHLSSVAKNHAETSRTSLIRGSISNKGPASVSAEATPLGHYKKTLSDAISSRWHYYVDHRIEFLSFGTATISFYVTQEGKIESLQLLSNTSNQSFADCCLKSVMEAKLPPIPPEVASTLQNKKLDVEYRFTISSD